MTAGFFADLWRRPVIDFGIPGVVKGKGGKHLMLEKTTDQQNEKAR
jgi:hypothetical protein